MIRINAHYVFLLNKFRHTDKFEGAITCFNIRPAWNGGGVVIQATNGHRYGVFHDPEGVCDVEKGIVFDPSPALVKACKGSKTHTAPQLIIETGQGAAVRVEDYAGHPVFVEPDPASCIKDLVFPNTELFLAERSNCHGYAAPKMHEISIPVGETGLFNFGDPVLRGLVMHPTRPGAPIFVTTCSHPNFLGIIMPMCLEDNEDLLAEVTNLNKAFLPTIKE